MIRRTISIAMPLLLIGAAPPSEPPAERTVTGDGIVDATLAGMPARIRIDPGAPSVPMLDAALAMRAGLEPGMFGTRYAIGPVIIVGQTAVTRIDTGTGPRKRRVSWSAESYAAGAEGTIGPGGLDEPVIRFVLRPPLAGERTVALPMVDGGGLFGGWSGLFALVEVDGHPMKIRFVPRHRYTLASAGAGQSIARAQGGVLQPGTDSAEIAFGVMRPVRAMRLARPLIVGPLSIGSVHVRIADYGSIVAIPEAGDTMDPDEIVVTGKKKRDRGRDRLSIGADQLDRCSAIVFDKPAKQIRLTCA